VADGLGGHPPQEVFDKSLLAYAIGEDPRVLLPQMVVQDGYFVSHIAGEVDMPAADLVDEFLPPYQLPFPLDPRRPVSHGPQIHPEQGRRCSSSGPGRWRTRYR
jgi:pyruvate ferredoxin oxidoreductase alpha subunit